MDLARLDTRRRLVNVRPPPRIQSRVVREGGEEGGDVPFLFVRVVVLDLPLSTVKYFPFAVPPPYWIHYLSLDRSPWLLFQVTCLVFI